MNPILRRLSLRRATRMIVGCTLGSYLGIALLGWVAGWQSSAALLGAGLLILAAGLSSVGTDAWSAAPVYGTALSRDLAAWGARAQAAGRPAGQRGVGRQWALVVIGLLVAGGGMVVPLIWG